MEPASTVVVTGASGYLGGHLVVELLKRNYTVIGCVRNVNAERKTRFLKALPEYASGKLKLVSADMTEPGAYDTVFQGPSTVFHPAEVFMSDDEKAAATQAIGSPTSLLEVLHAKSLNAVKNVVGSINKSSTVTRLVYTSSGASMKPQIIQGFEQNPVIDETREPSVSE
jgi:nucleoside-diphosphate-sugar epimerase